MTLVKSEATARLDAVNRAGMEAIGLFEDLDKRLPSDDLRALVAGHAGAQRRLLERAARLRRAHGEMPQAADPERSHLEAAGAFVRAALGAGSSSEHYVETLLEAADQVEEAVEAALALDLGDELHGVLETFKRDNERFKRELSAHR